MGNIVLNSQKTEFIWLCKRIEKEITASFNFSVQQLGIGEEVKLKDVSLDFCPKSFIYYSKCGACKITEFSNR